MKYFFCFSCKKQQILSVRSPLEMDIAKNLSVHCKKKLGSPGVNDRRLSTEQPALSCFYAQCLSIMNNIDHK